MEENKEFEKVEIQNGQIEAGIEIDPVTTDDTIQDIVNEDSINELVGEGSVIENVISSEEN